VFCEIFREFIPILAKGNPFGQIFFKTDIGLLFLKSSIKAEGK